MKNYTVGSGKKYDLYPFHKKFAFIFLLCNTDLTRTFIIVYIFRTGINTTQAPSINSARRLRQELTLPAVT